MALHLHAADYIVLSYHFIHASFILDILPVIVLHGIVTAQIAKAHRLSYMKAKAGSTYNLQIDMEAKTHHITCTGR